MNKNLLPETADTHGLTSVDFFTNPEVIRSIEQIARAYNHLCLAQMLRTGEVVNPTTAREQFFIRMKEDLFTRLRSTLQMPASLKGVNDIHSIEVAIMRDPRMMCNLWKLQQAGAKLIVTGYQEGNYIEFADAASDLDVPGQERGLAELQPSEIDAALDTILIPIKDAEKKTTAKVCLLGLLKRPPNARGLNYFEAAVFAAAHGGSLISYEAYGEMVKNIMNQNGETSNWLSSDLFGDPRFSGELSGTAISCAGKVSGNVVQTTGANRNVYISNRGARVAGLRVGLAA